MTTTEPTTEPATGAAGRPATDAAGQPTSNPAGRPPSGSFHGTVTKTSSSTDATAPQLWRTLRAPVAVLLLVLLLGAAIGYLNSRKQHGALDPRSYDGGGSRAIAELLRGEGVSVDLARTTEDAYTRGSAGSTLLVLNPALLQRPQLDALSKAGADRLVLVQPPEESLEVLAPGLNTAGLAEVDEREPGCSLPAARRAGNAETGGVLMEAEPSAGAVLCYAVDGNASLASLRVGRREVVVLGSASLLTNDRLDEDGNAALAMNLLGQESRLVWYLPTLGDALAGDRRSPYELIPTAWRWGLLQAAIAVLLLALWRMRRLGPVVVEPLPVVVRSAETVEGRARLYRRARARDRAGEVLRAAARERLAPLVGLPVFTASQALVDAVATRVGRPAGEVGALLYGSIPVDDSALVHLADDLDALESEVRRS